MRWARCWGGHGTLQDATPSQIAGRRGSCRRRRREGLACLGVDAPRLPVRLAVRSVDLFARLCHGQGQGQWSGSGPGSVSASGEGSSQSRLWLAMSVATATATPPLPTTTARLYPLRRHERGAPRHLVLLEGGVELGRVEVVVDVARLGGPGNEYIEARQAGRVPRSGAGRAGWEGRRFDSAPVS